MLSPQHNKIEEIHLTPTKKPKTSLEKTVGIVTIITAVIGTFITLATYLDTLRQNCDPAYPDLCIPKDSPDLQCSDIKERKFRVLPPDPHGFDGDKDGIGCEKN